MNNFIFEFDLLEEGYFFEDIFEYLNMHYQNLLSVKENKSIFRKYNLKERDK